MELQQTRVVLTGATGGIGTAIAQMLADGGAELLLVGRDERRLDALGQQLRTKCPSVETLAVDIATADGRRKVVSAASRRDVNLLINNAGINEFAFLERQDEAIIEAQIRINLLSPMLLVHGLLPVLRRQPVSQIVNMGSTFGSLGFAGFSPYCASKFGLRGFTESLRRELADTGIAVSYLAPRGARTKLNSQAVVAMNAELGNAMDDPERVAEAVRRIIVRRETERFVGQPEGFFARVNAVLPGLVDSVLRRKLSVIRHHAENPI